MPTQQSSGLNKDGSASSRPDDAVSDLMADHRKVEDLFKQYEKAGDNAEKKQRLVAQITHELRVHMAIEEEIFYPASRDFVESDMVNEAEVEHQGAKTLMEELEGMSPEDEYYDAKVKVLQEQIEHHVEEEETEYFPACRKSEMDLKGIADQMESRKAELASAA
ncbi:hemerythrin domain-containing protein [Phenylobacterium sp.]|uniref:hemerythrin domain-containing protein n=1 Tax=Phenylobacterium sp. TaxID=1871053 RepID=UPI0025E3C99E|nr:hemerythrin domain-containing protein [Phenylobacterium sp.]